ncbi:MAG: hypothetical protein ACYC3I_14625 [Gemmataceae bacterium]
MNRVVVDPATLTILRNARQTLDVCDESGKVAGRFIPTMDHFDCADIEPRISEAELNRRERAGGGRPLADILTALEKRS